jgi:hypothetical protein
VGPRVVDDAAVVRDETRGQPLVDGRPTERGLEGPPRGHRDPVERHPMRRAHEHGGQARPPAEQGIGMRGDGPGVAQSRVG